MSSELKDVLVCFAVKEEAKPFQEQLGTRTGIQVLLTGIGRSNAERAILRLFTAQKPGLILSCGFAGGLNPEAATGTVLFDADGEAQLEKALLEAGASVGRFYCAPEIAITAERKRELWKSTGADAVEMESQFICSICSERKIPHATVRVILDTASEDLPLDFNALMRDDQQISPAKIAVAVAKSPGKIGALLRLQKQSQAAAQKLAEVLLRVTAPKL